MILFKSAFEDHRFPKDGEQKYIKKYDRFREHCGLKLPCVSWTSSNPFLCHTALHSRTQCCVTERVRTGLCDLKEKKTMHGISNYRIIYLAEMLENSFTVLVLKFRPETIKQDYCHEQNITNFIINRGAFSQKLVVAFCYGKTHLILRWKIRFTLNLMC